MYLKGIFIVLTGLSTVSAMAWNGPELQDSFPVKKLNFGHEFILEKAVKINSKSTSILFQNGVQISLVLPYTAVCELTFKKTVKILEPRKMVIAEDPIVHGLQVSWPISDPVVSEMTCFFPNEAKMTIGDLRKAFVKEAKIEVREAENYDEILEEID